MKKSTKIIFLFILGMMLFMFLADNAIAANEWLVSSDPVSCGNINNIPKRIPEFFSSLINIVQVIVPVLLVLFGVLDLIKGMMSQKEDEIKKGQQALIKRLIIGIIVFLIIILVKFLVSALAEGTNNKNNIIDCIDCFVSGSCLN